MTRLQRFAWATLGSTLVLVAIGGYTRGSGSGFGCEDRWPLCKNGAVGGLLPRWEHNMVIEWTHRWVAAIVGVLALLTAIAAWRDRRTTRAVAGPAIAAVVLISAQAYLGRMVVKNELDADLVALHLANAMAVIGLLAVVAVNARRSTGRGEVPGEVLAPAERVWVGMLATGAALSLLVLLLGSSVHNEYVGGWPLVGNELIPDLASRVVQVHFAHRVAAGMLLVYCAWLAVRVVHLRRPRREVLLVHGAAGAC
ncbi:MAG: COX15/CtaA family protein [Acidimicrobiia bacterium]|nr:COX15/CtaA family protein [Acidimicrobiia bacterium]